MSNTLHADDFPREGSTEEQLRFLLRYAILAPSSHNSQPWLWQIEGDEVVLRADRTRAMRGLDPNGRELIMSCGAALQHLCLAMRALGFAALVQTFPNPSQSDLLARVRLAGHRSATPHDELLFRFITQRHTHRGQFEERPLPLELLSALQVECEAEGAALHYAQSAEQREAIIGLVERGDLIQNRDPASRRDIANWIAPTGERPDGIPASALGISDLMSHVVPLAQRYLDRGEMVAAKDKRLASNAPVLAVLSTSEDTPQGWLGAGQALGRLLLRARAAGVWASFFSQPIQVNEPWFQLRHMTGVHHFPQLVFRLGYASPVSGTPRRPVEDVTTVVPLAEPIGV